MLVSSEDDLIVYLGRKEHRTSTLVKVFPKVSILSRKIEVSPDIDLLEIREISERNGIALHSKISKETIGYETKLLTYRKNWKRFDYRPIYQGIGESLLYFNYRIEKVYLVIGFDTTSVPDEHRTKLIDKISDVAKTLAFKNLNNYFGLMIVQILNGSVWSVTNTLWIKSKYYSSDRDFRFRRQCLIDEEFSYNHELYDRIYR